MCMEIDTSKIHVMGSEPLPGVEPDDIREWCRVHTSVQDMIDAYAVTHNKAWWIEDDEYDFEEGTQEWKIARDRTNRWFELMNEFEDKIYDLIRKQGTVVPDKGRIVVLEPFMEEYGYFDGDGWWFKIGED